MNNIYIVHRDIDFSKELINYLNKKTAYNIIGIPLKINFLEKIIYKFSMILKKDWTKFWAYSLSKTIKISSKEDFIIIIDSGRGKYFAPLLRKKYPNNRMAFWFWNIVSDLKNFKDIESIFSRNIFTFDKNDSLKYNLKYLNQFYWSTNDYEESIPNILYDVVFIGFDHGRREKINLIKEELTKENLLFYFHIVNENTLFERYYKKNTILPYYEVRRMTLQSKAILEILKDGQVGLTLRALEALFFNKKLITNNLSIKEYDFYCEENIYIYGEERRIGDFLKQPVKLLGEEIKRKYSAEVWLEKIIKESGNDS
nr:hypothetical protein [Fusobacterium gastrosuis]